jgi:23S rRNA (cytidine1920-2'-O)/16S rRNA (cytidine1409-2'-O)-methyltransferase
VTEEKKTSPQPYAGRGGEKLAFALETFGVDPSGAVCADLGSHIGGFVDCWLRAGAAKVYSVDTCYGTLAWKLRQDPRVEVMERTNALHVEIPERVDFVSCDVGWTRQERILPKALSLVKPGGTVLSLLKPQYEAEKKTEILRGKGRVRPEAIPSILARVGTLLRELGIPFRGPVETPFRGDKGGNPEFFLALGPVPESA